MDQNCCKQANKSAINLILSQFNYKYKLIEIRIFLKITFWISYSNGMNK